MKSSACRLKNTLMRSVSEPMRAIKSPVRLLPKYSSDRPSNWSKVAVRRSAAMRSLTSARM